MKRLLTATAITAALMLPGVAKADLTPDQMAKADQIRDARTATRTAFQTKASKAEYNKIVKTLDKKVPGRSCDADDWLLACEMEDGTSISVEAVPVNTSEAKAKELCTNPYAEEPEEIKAELKGHPKQGFLMLWCTTTPRDWSTNAAQKRIETDKSFQTKGSTPASTGDKTIYVRMIVGAEVCQLDKDPDIRRLVGFAKEELAKRVLDKEITSEQIAATKKKTLEQDRSSLCKGIAEMYRIMNER